MIIPPVPTPFDRQGRPDWTALQALLERLSPYVDGFLIFGSNGEAPLLFPEERRRGLGELEPPKPFLVGVGDESLPQARVHLLAAKEAGAFAALAFPPRFFSGLLDLNALVRYYLGLTEAGLPVWLYHVPQLTKVDLPLHAVARLAQIPGLEGIKDSSGEVSRFAYYQAQRLPLRVYSGNATVFLAGLVHGVEGGILAVANIVPHLARALLEAFREGDLARAQALQNRLDALSRLLGRGGPVLLKQAMRHLGLPAGYPRPPYAAESPLWDRFEPLLEALAEEGWTVS